MAHELAIALAQKIRSGLQRKSYSTCSKWAEGCRVMGQPFPGPWSFRHHPWTRGMHDSEAELNVGQKSAQMGYTETVLNRTFYNLDIRGIDCLYVLPSKTPDASDFSAARFDAALDLSPYLNRMFSDVRNVGHKKAGTNNLYIRGGRSRGGLKSIPVGYIVIDEVNEIPEENVPLAFERTSGQVSRELWLISTPTVPKFGINQYFLRSSQNHFFFKCPHCSRSIELRWPDSFEVVGEHEEDPRTKESYLKCHDCHHKLEHADKIDYLNNGYWVPSHSDKDEVGWYINQLYSMTVSPEDIAKSFLRAQVNQFEEQEFFNSKLGLAHAVEGSGIGDNDLENCTKGYKTFDAYHGTRLITMGVDIGKWLHYEINEWIVGPSIGSDINYNSMPRVLKAGKVLHFEDLDELMVNFRVNMAVLDKYPEPRKALEFAMRFFGHVKLCTYEQGISGKFIHINDDEHATIKVDRTSWLDLSLGRFKTQRIQIPRDTTLEYKDQIKASIRVYEKDKTGNPTAKYVNIDPDHHSHARNYAEIALPLAASIGEHQSIRSGL